MIDLIFDVLPQIHGVGHEGLGAVKGLVAFLTFLESLASMNVTQIFAAFLPGITTLNNIHPLLVHFPITLFTVFFISDLLGCLFKKTQWRQFASFTLYLGTISAILTITAGFQAAYSVSHNDATHLIMLRHQSFAIALTLIAFSLSMYRYFADQRYLQKKTYIQFSLSSLLTLLLIFTADLGGLMVYEYGIAVKKPAKIISPVISHSHTHLGHSHHAH
jgi:uncharacterized membrane protein